jgi:hypothetical protein
MAIVPRQSVRQQPVELGVELALIAAAGTLSR